MRFNSLLLVFFSCANLSSGFQHPVKPSGIPAATKAHHIFTSRPFRKNGKSGLFRHPSPRTAASNAATEGDWTKKRLHNTPLFRSGAILAALGLAGFASGSPIAKMPSKVAAVLHLLSFATWFGTVFYTTFIFGITAFKNLPRKMFGKLQSKLFPKYFMLGSLTILIQLITLSNLSGVTVQKSIKALGVSFGMTLLNQFYLEPASTKIMFARYEREEEDGGKETDEYKKLAAEFGKFHGISSLTNLIAMCGAVAAWCLPGFSPRLAGGERAYALVRKG
eukprot:CAMPEP_0113578458 /NCGR_PEP_ID=MMETSP0015_2-20120614/29497_1 /TAXON_ID=2838 /ORGANISM="Odontella" /LENGTH=277 /DNA_ID=CAMNT_0000482275 /DNA_START=15 /DNA_END=847 /DNA_ORIENTATION=- /assembly_acc=CAM_ASM_000160